MNKAVHLINSRGVTADKNKPLELPAICQLTVLQLAKKLKNDIMRRNYLVVI